MTGSASRWSDASSHTGGAAYAARFQARADQGLDVHGEASFCAGLLPVGARVLDAGCGTGRVANRLQELGLRCTGVDADESMLTEARRVPQIRCLLADLADSLTMSAFAASFDLVVAAGNVVPLLAAGTEAAVVATLAACLVAGGLLVAGFGLDAAHLPLAAAPFGLEEYDEWCSAAGLALSARYPGWDGVDGAIEGYAVSVHRLEQVVAH